MAFLINSKKDMLNREIDIVDFVLVTGDAYVDHPSFGAAVIARKLESHGFVVAILDQPKLTKEDFSKFGEPKLGYLVTAGNIDSMVNHYTVSKRKRKKDLYSPNAKFGLRPDRATIKYSHVCKETYPNSPVIIGGVEASLRRLAHYDYWDNKVRRSIILDSRADLLIYGMAETTIIEVAEALQAGMDVKDLIYLRGTVWKTKDKSMIDPKAIRLPSYDEIIASKKLYSESHITQRENTDSIISKTLYEEYKNNICIQNPPALPLSVKEMDDVYDLPYERDYHPKYKNAPIPAINEVKFSIIANRGCFGACSFCALTSHQGRTMQTRSESSIIKECKMIIQDKDFKGYIHDVGGPTANFYQKACDKQIKHGTCKSKECLDPGPCSQLNVSHDKYLNLLRKLRKMDGVKKVFVRSGLRYDYMMYDKDDTFFNELVEHHVSGQLKVAPEHISDKVLYYLGKPGRGLYDRFVKKYYDINKKINKEQYLVPYLMSSHPGSSLKEAIELAEYIRDMGYNPEQVQDFYPTPGTMSTSMYYTGIDPRTMKEVYVPKTPHEKAMQRALIQYRNPKNRKLVKEALEQEKRFDLIGDNPKKHLIRSFEQQSRRHKNKRY